MMDTDDKLAGGLRSTDLQCIIAAALEGHEKQPTAYNALRNNYNSLMCASFLANHPYENAARSPIFKQQNIPSTNNIDNEICCCTCPTGVGALHLPQGITFHSVFRTWAQSLCAGTAIDEISKSLGGNQLKMVVVDEVSMLSAQFLVLLDTRLQSMYIFDQTFGGISILLIGDFIQFPVTTGCDLWSVMYGTVSGMMVLHVICFNNFM